MKAGLAGRRTGRIGQVLRDKSAAAAQAGGFRIGRREHKNKIPVCNFTCMQLYLCVHVFTLQGLGGDLGLSVEELRLVFDQLDTDRDGLVTPQDVTAGFSE